MQFRVGATRGSGSAYRLPKKLSDFKRITAADVPKDAVERFVMLSFDGRGMPTMWELVDADPDAETGAGIIQIELPGGTRTFRITAQSFEETTNFRDVPSHLMRGKPHLHWGVVAPDRGARPIAAASGSGHVGVRRHLGRGDPEEGTGQWVIAFSSSLRWPIRSAFQAF